MVAAGRGVFLGTEVGMRGRKAAINFYLLQEPERHFELSAIWKNQTYSAPISFRDRLESKAAAGEIKLRSEYLD